MSVRIPVETLAHLASDRGLRLVSLLSSSQAEFRSKLASEHLQAWVDQGYSGEMGYLQRRSKKFDSPSSFLKGARSLAVFLIPYCDQHGGVDHRPRRGYARIARYAWGRDYHEVIRFKLRELVAALQRDVKVSAPLNFRVFTDSAPIFERSLAEAAKLGFLGKNGLLITPRSGSYNFIATVIWDVEIEGRIDPDIHISGCGSCSSCIQRCPTSAIIRPGVLDARRCISYLTIERKSSFNSAELGLLGDWAFGCDVCQEVCPFNNPGNSGEIWTDFDANSGPGPWLSLSEIFSLSSREAFEERFAGTSLLRAGRECLIRNCIAVAVNTQHTDELPTLQRLAIQDQSPYVRFHAGLGVSKLQSLL